MDPDARVNCIIGSMKEGDLLDAIYHRAAYRSWLDTGGAPASAEHLAKLEPYIPEIDNHEAWLHGADQDEEPRDES